MPPAADAPRAGSTRHLPRWLLIVAGALLVARVGSGVWDQAHPPVYEERIRWRTLAQGVEEARRTRRPILYDFTADWCPPCRLMQSELFGDPEASAQITSSFVPIRVLDRQREEGRNAAWVDSLQRHYQVTVFPTLVVARLGGGEPTVITGYPGKTQTLQMLSRAMMRGMMPGLPRQGP
jgi:thiol:disulfide interchange protein